MKKLFALALIATGFALGAGTAYAEEVDYSKATYTPWYFPSEASIGAGATDPTQGKELSPDVTGELMFTPVGNDSWWEELRFRPTLGINANLGGKTSYGYGGMTFDLVNYDHFFLDGFFGLSGNTGMTDPKGVERFTHKALGSNVLFREAVSAGYQFAPQYAISAYLDHQSDAELWSKINNGIETAGVRLSYMFQAEAPTSHATDCCAGTYKTYPQ